MAVGIHYDLTRLGFNSGLNTRPRMQKLSLSQKLTHSGLDESG